MKIWTHNDTNSNCTASPTDTHAQQTWPYFGWISLFFLQSICFVSFILYHTPHNKIWIMCTRVKYLIENTLKLKKSPRKTIIIQLSQNPITNKLIQVSCAVHSFELYRFHLFEFYRFHSFWIYSYCKHHTCAATKKHYNNKFSHHMSRITGLSGTLIILFPIHFSFVLFRWLLHSRTTAALDKGKSSF